MIAVTYIAHLGTDQLVCDAARVSMARQASEFTAEQNARLIAYLAKHGHFTPFTHPQITLHIAAPIFVARQLFKSKIGFSGDDDCLPDQPFAENEVSRRYVDSYPAIFTPQWRERATHKKQGSGGELSQAGLATLEYELAVEDANKAYNRLLKIGVAPEQARAVLPQGTLTEWFWTGSLAAWARLWRLRTATDAQAETGEVVRMAGAIISPLFPQSWPSLTRQP